jgi:dTDP-4-dehydrorhamnose reductase
MKDRLILGDGVLGTKLVKQTGWDYISRKKDGIDFRVIDSYKDHLFGYDEIINCIACTNTYDENKEENWNINYKGVVALVDHLIDKDIKFIHISTDYLYAHSKQNASEKDVPVHCGNWYGYTKLLGDAYVQLRLKDYLLIRSTHKEEPFPYEKAWINQVGNFDYVSEIATLQIELIKKGVKGVFNIGTDLKTMYELAKKTNPNVKPEFELFDDTTPTDLTMNISKMRKELNE